MYHIQYLIKSLYAIMSLNILKPNDFARLVINLHTKFFECNRINKYSFRFVSFNYNSSHS